MKLFTYGYAGGKPEDLQSFLEETGALLVDIRMSPRSKMAQWTGQALRERFGTTYLHLPQLGNLNYANGGPIKLANPAQALDRLRPILAERSIILLCACYDWQRCHRLTAATFLADELGCEVEHLPGRFATWNGVTTQQDGDVWRCLSLTQPYATLVASGAKRIETRNWKTNYRGPLAIHAAKGFPSDYQLLCLHQPFRSVLETAGYHVRAATSGRRYVEHDLPVGVIVATCRLTSCTPTDLAVDQQIFDVCPPHERAFGDYTIGRWAWILDDVTALPEPIPARGSLGLWSFSGAGLPNVSTSACR